MATQVQKDLIKSAAQIAVGLKLIKASKEMKRMRKENMEKENNPPEHTVPAGYEYVFQEFAVKKVSAVVSALVGVILTSGVRVDPVLISAAKDVLDTMEMALNPNQEDLPPRDSTKESNNGIKA